jgi:hypothetical protein
MTSVMLSAAGAASSAGFLALVMVKWRTLRRWFAKPH